MAYNQPNQPINNSNFAAAAKMIQYGNLQPSLVQNIVKQELQRNRLMYTYPASVGNAIIHRDAYKFGYSKLTRGQLPRVCPCCLQRVQTEDIGICYNTTQVEFSSKGQNSESKLRPGILLFFSFVKMLFMYLVFRFVICDGFNLLTNIIGGSYCQDAGQNQCSYTLQNSLSLFNKKNHSKYILIQDILSLVSIILSIAFFFFYRKKQYGKAKTLNESNQVEQDYAILVEQIPLIDFPSKSQTKKMRVNQGQVMQLYHRQHLWRFFQSKIKLWLEKRGNWRNQRGNNEADFYNLISKNNGQLRSQQIVKSVSLCYNLQRLQTLQRQRDQLIKNRKKYQNLRKQLENNPEESGRIQQIQSDNRFSSVPKQVSFLNDCQVILNKQYASDNSVLFNITHFVGKAFISFQYQHYMEYILQQAERNVNFLLFNGSRLKVSRVSNPRDIYWKHLRHSRQKQNKKIFSTILFLIVIVVVCFGLLCGIQYLKFVIEQNNNLKIQNPFLLKVKQYGFVGVAILIILLANRTIAYISRKKTKQQCHYSKSEQSLSTIYKTIFFQFICTAILPYVVSRIFNSGIAGRVGLVFFMTWFIIINGLIINVLSILLPKSIYRSCIQMCKYRNNKKPEDFVEKFQIQLNEQFQYVQFDIVNQYINYILLTFVACFYAYLIPVTIPILAVLFLFQFWIDKINLFKRCSHPRNFSFNLTRNILKIFEVCVWLFALGTFIFGIYIHGTALHLINIIGLAISTLYLWFLFGSSVKIERKLFGGYQSSSNLLYDDCLAEAKFEETFWTSNPATCLVKESQITGRKNIFSPGLNKIFVTYSNNQR